MKSMEYELFIKKRKRKVINDQELIEKLENVEGVDKVFKGQDNWGREVVWVSGTSYSPSEIQQILTSENYSIMKSRICFSRYSFVIKNSQQIFSFEIAA